MDAWLWALLASIAGGLLAIVVAWWLLRRFARPPQALLERIGRLPWRAKARLAVALFRDRRIPLRVRLVIPALVLYLAMPLDIIPDFIPIIGQLDDVLVVLIGLRLLLRGLPEGLLEEHLTALEKSAAASV